MKAIRTWITPNPILVKEIRSRMRGARAFITLTVALVVMAALMIGLTSLLTRSSNMFGNMLSPQIGQVLFDCLIFFELLLVCTITPAITAGAISSEREKLTFEMLLATPLGPARILWGKLISALGYVMVLIFAAVPLGSLVFLFGGVALPTMLKALFMLVVIAVTQGVYGLFLSALLGRTGRSTVVSFVSVAGLMFGPLVTVIANGLFYSGRMLMPRFLLAFSPVSMLLSAVDTGSNTNNGGLTSIFAFFAGQWDPSMNPLALTQIPRPIYHYSLAIYGVLTIVLFTLSIALINPARRFHLSKRHALIGSAVLASFVAVMGAAFLLTAPRYEWIKADGSNNQVVVQGQVGAVRAVPPNVKVEVQAIAAPTAIPAQAAGYPGPDMKSTPTVITAQGALMPLKDQVAIYAAAARQVYLKDSTIADPNPQFPVIYLVSMTNDKTGSPDQPDAGSTLLAADLQDGITTALSDLLSRVVWVNGLDAVPKVDQNAAIQEGGLAITFGNIQLQTDGSVQLPASAYVSGLVGGGQTYRLEKTAGIWKVTGTAGTSWIQ